MANQGKRAREDISEGLPGEVGICGEGEANGEGDRPDRALRMDSSMWDDVALCRGAVRFVCFCLLRRLLARDISRVIHLPIWTFYWSGI